MEWYRKAAEQGLAGAQYDAIRKATAILRLRLPLDYDSDVENKKNPGNPKGLRP